MHGDCLFMYVPRAHTESGVPPIESILFMFGCTFPSSRLTFPTAITLGCFLFYFAFFLEGLIKMARIDCVITYTAEEVRATEAQDGYDCSLWTHFFLNVNCWSQCRQLALLRE